MRHHLILPGTLALLIGLTGCAGAGAGAPRDAAHTATPGSGDSASRAPVDLTGTVRIRELYDVFLADRSRAEKGCYGQSVTVQAVALKTGASEYGTPAIEASDVENGTHLATLVLPYDDRRAESFRRLESVKIGEEIVVTATCNVFADRNNVLIFKNSEIVE